MAGLLEGVLKGIVYRKVKIEDAEEYVDFHNRVWRCAYKNIFPEEVFVEKESRRQQKIDEFGKKLNDDSQINYVALHQNKIVGMMGGFLSSPIENFENFADLGYLYIDPDFQNNGIGTRLKEIFVKWAKQHGARKFVVGVLKDNLNARRVYEIWGGKLDKFTRQIDRLGKQYEEVFYTFII